MPSRELLTAQAMFLGVSPELYIRGSEDLRTDFMEKHLAKLRKNAKASPYQKVEDYVERNMMHYPRTEEDLKLRKTNSAEIQKKRRGRPPKIRQEVQEISDKDEQDTLQAPVLEPPYEMQGSVRVYHDMG